MGTKNNPSKFDCYDKALPDEPMFVLLARDPYFAVVVRLWALMRRHDINTGERPEEDMAVVHEANTIASEGEAWRDTNEFVWRKED